MGTSGLLGPSLISCGCRRDRGGGGRLSLGELIWRSDFPPQPVPPWAGLWARRWAQPGLPGRGWLIRQETLGSGHILLLLLVTAAPMGRKILSSQAAPPPSQGPSPIPFSSSSSSPLERWRGRPWPAALRALSPAPWPPSPSAASDPLATFQGPYSLNMEGQEGRAGRDGRNTTQGSIGS